MFFVLYFEDSTELYGFVQVIRCYTSTRNTADKDLNVGGGQKHPHLLKKKTPHGWNTDGASRQCRLQCRVDHRQLHALRCEPFVLASITHLPIIHQKPNAAAVIHLECHFQVGVVELKA